MGCFGSISYWHLSRGQIPKPCSREHCISFKECWRKSFDQFPNLEYQDYITTYGKDWVNKK